MSPPEFQPGELLRVLAAHEVDFVIIGGMAAAAHGAPYPTYDLDIVPASDHQNLERLSSALRELDAHIRAEGNEGGLPFDHDATSLRSVAVWNLATPFGALDLSFVPSGTDGFADLKVGSSSQPVFGVVVRLASLSDVIRSKEAAGRDKDKLMLPVLRRILASRKTGP